MIFDCDGVLVDSDRISLRIQAEWISALGLKMTYEDCVREFLGLGMEATLRVLAKRLGRPVPEGWAAELDTAVRKGFERELRPIPRIVEALEEIELPTCIASSGSHEKMRFTLGLTGLGDRFAGRIFSVEEVQRGKPVPDLFLHAASRMSTSPEQCIVVEDSPFGIAAAKAAGMSALGFAAATPAARLDGADAVFTATRVGARLTGPIAPLLFGNRLGRTVALWQATARPWRMSGEAAIRGSRAMAAAPAFKATVKAAGDYRFTGSLGDVPVTIGWGTRDRLLFWRQAKRAQAALPNARFVPLSGCGHVPMTDDPQRIATVLLEGSDTPRVPAVQISPTKTQQQR